MNAIYNHLVIKTVADYYNMPYKVLLQHNSSRAYKYVKLRQIVMYIIHNANIYTTAQTASLFAKDHANLFYAIKTVQAQIDTNKNYRDDIAKIMEILKERIAERGIEVMANAELTSCCFKEKGLEIHGRLGDDGTWNYVIRKKGEYFITMKDLLTCRKLIGKDNLVLLLPETEKAKMVELMEC